MAEVFSKSYDPRTWVPSELLAAVNAPTASVVATVAADGGRQGGARPGRLTLALGVSGLLLAGGFAAAWLSRPAANGEAKVAARDAAATATAVRRRMVLGAPGDLEGALRANGLTDVEAAAATAAIRPGLPATGELRAAMLLDNAGGVTHLLRLEVSNPDSSGVVLRRAPAGFALSKVAAQLSTRVVVKRGRLDGESFYSSAVAAGITDSLIPGFARALAFDFDFQREIGPGDAFEAAFAQPVNADGEAVGPPELLYAALTTSLKSVAVYRFAPPGEAADWFDSSGRSIIRALMRTPIDGARVSSGFGVRKHPVLGYMKLHRGTDFAAPTGTPIFAAGDGLVEFAAPKGPNGNFVRLRHDNGWETLYLHMNAFAPGLAAGQRVIQGQPIGAVGTTGRSTGPHLHYEVHIDGEPVDPQSIVTEQGKTLSGPALVAFEAARDRIDVSRAAQAN